MIGASVWAEPGFPPEARARLMHACVLRRVYRDSYPYKHVLFLESVFFECVPASERALDVAVSIPPFKSTPLSSGAQACARVIVTPTFNGCGRHPGL